MIGNPSSRFKEALVGRHPVAMDTLVVVVVVVLLLLVLVQSTYR
jgi:hypothetical protein